MVDEAIAIYRRESGSPEEPPTTEISLGPCPNENIAKYLAQEAKPPYPGAILFSIRFGGRIIRY